MPLDLKQGRRGGLSPEYRIYGVAPTVILPPRLANLRSWRLFSGVKIINNIHWQHSCDSCRAAAYARSPRGLLASGRSSVKPMRRNLAPILVDGSFPCCAFSLRRACSHNLLLQDVIGA